MTWQIFKKFALRHLLCFIGVHPRNPLAYLSYMRYYVTDFGGNYFSERCPCCEARHPDWRGAPPLSEIVLGGTPESDALWERVAELDAEWHGMSTIDWKRQPGYSRG